MAVKDVVNGNDKFIAVVSDGTKSDVLVVDAAATEYYKASERAALIFADGNEAVVRVPAINNSETPITGKMIIAVYNGNKLVQIEIEDAEIPGSFNGEIKQDIEFNSHVNGDCKMRVFLWSSVDSMEPLCEASPFFE